MLKKTFIIADFASETGASHHRLNKVCQDYSFAYAESKNMFSFASVSDGHGGEKYFRSHLGSRFAVEAAYDVANELNLSYRKIAINLKKNFAYKDELIANVVSRIIIGWNDKCSNHLSNNPFEQDELFIRLEDKYKQSILNHPSSSELENEILNLKAYGCTLLAYFSFKDFSFILKLGDGNAVVYNKNGTVMEPVSLMNEDFKFNITSSLSQDSAFRQFKSIFFDLENRPVAIFLSTDGVINSFESTSTYFNFLNEIHDMYTKLKENSSENPKIEMIDGLKYITHTGSGDDVSIAFVIEQHDVKEKV